MRLLSNTARFLATGLIALFVLAGSAHALEKCLICHGKKDLYKTEQTGRKVSLYVDTTMLKKSVHASRSCTDCHVDITVIPHHKNPQKVNCRRCHYSGNPVGAPQGELYDQYEHSIHGIEVAKGNPKAPVCQDCHGTHNVIVHTDPASNMYKANIPATCGRCHIDIYATYRESVHGQAIASGNLDAPVCSDCHGEHNIIAPSQPDSKVSPMHVTETCSKCHGPKGVVAKYGIKTDRMATFEESFHGVAQQMQNTMVANCASCHGYHDIRAENDPKSSIYPANIPKTCGKPQCHPEANANFAEGKIHVDPKSESSGAIYYISKGFMVLTVSTLCGLFVLILLDLYRRVRKSNGKKQA
ncbi:MAG TPA: hypothetical protein VJ983_10900 [candidate division Zixibacteria bacterium]|nr:hypothetical protein [candidate division Zixibacteria bacterium]